MREILVGRGTVEVSDDADTVMATSALGTGVVVIAYHPEKNVGGILHALLPRELGRSKVSATWPALFVRSGCALLLTRLKGLGIERDGLQLRLVGGAELMAAPLGMAIGARNLAMARLVAWQESLPILAVAGGGQQPLSVRLYIANGEVALMTPTGESSL